MPGVGRNSYKKAQQKAKEKTNPQSFEGPIQDPNRIDFNSDVSTNRMPDRSPDEVPTKSLFARMTGYYPSATPRYKKAFYKLNEGQVAIAKSGPEGKKAVASMEGKSVEEINSALPRHMKFCGGMSKPYKKK